MESRVVEKLLNLAREKREKEGEGDRALSRSFVLSRKGLSDDPKVDLATPVETDDDAFPPFDSELYERLIFEEKYFTCNDDWKEGKSPDTIKRASVEQERFIRERVKGLFSAVIKLGSLDEPQDLELRFLLEHFYTVSDHARSIDDSLSHTLGVHELTDRACDCAINLAFSLRGQTFDEAYWEVEKLFDYSERLTFEGDICNFEDDIKAARRRLSKAEAWELDMLLAQVSVRNITHELWSRADDYFEKFGKAYDEERITKDGMRLLIKCGARLNRAILPVCSKRVECNIDDKIRMLAEHIPNKIIVPVEEDGVRVLRYAENVKENRLRKLYYAVKSGLKIELSLERFCEAFDGSELFPVEWLICGAEKILGGGTKEDALRFASKRFAREIALWDGCKKDEKRLFAIENELDGLRARYARGERIVEVLPEAGDCEIAFIKRFRELSYSQFVACRDEALTHELLLALNDAPLTEIRQRFFRDLI